MENLESAFLIENEVLRILGAPRPPADQEYFHQMPSMDAFCRIRSPLDLALLATLHWRGATKGRAFFSTAKPFHGFGRRAIQNGLKRLEAGGFIAREGVYAFKLIRGTGTPVRASFLSEAREGVSEPKALAVRLLAALAGGMPPGQRAIKRALGVSDSKATLLTQVLGRCRGPVLSMEAAPHGAVFSLRPRKAAAPNRAFYGPADCPESCAINYSLKLKENQSNYREEKAMQEIDSFKVKINKIMPEGEVVAVYGVLRDLWRDRPPGFGAEQFLRAGFDVWLSRGPGEVLNLAGYLSASLDARTPTAPTPAVDRAFAKLEAEEALRVLVAKNTALNGVRLSDRQKAEAAAADEAEALYAEMEALHPGFRRLGIAKQAALIMAMGAS